MNKARIINLVCLILAGEIIFSLPFHITRYFRPTFLEAFDLSNAALGDIFALYGVIAMLSYFPGGLLADKFSVRRLLAFSLFATALGGLYLATIPSAAGLRGLFAYWGMTTILLFWAALLRATREWGGSNRQGLAFGLLDGGRGLAAALAASCAVALLAAYSGDETAALAGPARERGLEAVIYFYSGLTATVGLLCWFFVAETSAAAAERPSGQLVTRVLGVVRNPCVWFQSAIVLCAYCAYKGLDNYGVYLVDVLEVSELRAAELMALSAYLRPLGAIAAGLIADRYRPSQVICWTFLALLGIYTVLATQAPTGIRFEIIAFNLGVSFLAVFALRGIYFALLHEGRVAAFQTGTAIGLVSVIGYTPDVFFYAVGGRLIDRNPGLVGHQHYFLMLAAIACLGLVAALFLYYFTRRQSTAVS